MSPPTPKTKCMKHFESEIFLFYYYFRLNEYNKLNVNTIVITIKCEVYQGLNYNTHVKFTKV